MNFSANDLELVINKILFYLKEERSLDFTGNRVSMLERRISKRIIFTGYNSFDDYYQYLITHDKEIDKLVNVLTINVSSFFRDPLIWESLNKSILPELIEHKKGKKEESLRIWSAGCSSGEEPFSLAILLNEKLEQEEIHFDTHIFATDIDAEILQKAKQSIYNYDSVKLTKLEFINKYFTENKENYELNSNIREMVKFSFFDLLDEKKYTPPGSVFGNFDIVLCRNVLIYFRLEFQKRIFTKLHRALNRGGYLILGEAEVPIDEFRNEFRRVNNCCKIYQKK